MSDWKYSNSIKEYPVRAGDVWSVGDRHIFVCGDLQGESRIDKVVDELKPQLMYTDPPWTNSLATGFRTKAGVDGEKGKKVNVDDLIKRILGFAKTLKVPCFIEGGCSEKDMNRRTISETGGLLHREWQIKYGKNLPCMIYFADYREHPTEDFNQEITGEDDIYTPFHVIHWYKPNYVFDPCGGRGTTAVMAGAAGCGSILHELSPYRMADAIKFTADTQSFKAKLESRL